MYTKKGQYLSFDVIVASVIFLISLVMLMSYWQSMKSTVMNENKYLSSTAMLVSDNLLTDYSSIGIYKKGTHIVDCRYIINNKKKLSESSKEFSGGNDVYVAIVSGCGDGLAFGTDDKGPNQNENINLARVVRVISTDDNGKSLMGTMEVFVYKNEENK